MPTDAADEVPEDDDGWGDDDRDDAGSRALVPVPKPEYGPLTARSGAHRAAMQSLLNNIYSQTFTEMKMTFNNLPPALLRKKLTKEEVAVSNLPAVFDGIDTYFKHVLNALQKHPDMVPEDVDKDNLRHAFMALALVEQSLNEMVEIHGAKRNGRGVTFGPDRFIESDQRGQGGKLFTALDVGAQQDGRNGRRRELSATEKASLKDCAKAMVIYSAVAAQLLGVQLVGFKMVEKEEYGKFNIEHTALDSLASAAPPEPWAAAMQGFSIKIPTEQNPNITMTRFG